MLADLLRPDPIRDDELRRQICHWLEVNGIDYNDVPIDARCGIAGRSITCRVYYRRNGKLIYLADLGGPARGTVVTPLKVFPPRRVRAWLAYWHHEPGNPLNLAADGLSYHRRSLARRRRRS